MTKEPCLEGFLRRSAWGASLIAEGADFCNGKRARFQKCLTMRRIYGRDLSFGTVAERIAPESLTPELTLLRSPQHIARIFSFGTRSSLQATGKRWFDDEFLKSAGGVRVESEVGKSQWGFWLTYPLPLRERVAKSSTARLSRVRVYVPNRTPHPARIFRCEPPSPARGEGRGYAAWKIQFVLATRGGMAVVTNCVASSMATPSGVGITMR